MGLDLTYIQGQTPIDFEEKKELLIKTITNRDELNEFEQLGIEKAIEWIYKKKFTQEQLLSEEFIKLLHKRMFGEVWRWAGSFRKSNKNIGVDKFQIPIKVKNLIEDCRYWIENAVYSEDEICVRFKHKLVFIHPFTNGNGRHSRLLADIMVEKLFNKPVFTWGRRDLSENSDTRKLYLEYLKQADIGNYHALLQFARS